MNKMQMIWNMAGDLLFELMYPTGEVTPLEVINNVTLRTSIPVNEVLDLMKLELPPNIH